LELKATDGRDLEPLARQSKYTALLCYLAAAVPHGRQRRDTLLALFWPEHDESHARASLSQALYVLRNELGEQTIVTRGDGEVGLARDVVWCDVRAFEAAIEAGKPAEALELYRGGLLDGFHLSGAPEFDRWLEDERERLRDRAADAAWALAESQAATDVVQAARWARWAAALAPADEAVMRRLMTFLHRLGDRAAALRAYEAFAFRLTQEYELEPSTETQALAQRIRREKPAVAPAVRPSDNQAPSPEPSYPPRRHVIVPALGAAVLVAALVGGVVAYRRATATTFRRIAVLPLENLTGDTAQQYFVDGMHDALLTELAKIGALSVISRTSVLGFRHTTKTAPEIARELHVDGVVEGSVVLAGDSVRINARLIDGSTDKHLWADSFVRNRRHVLALYGDVAQAIAREVHAAVTPEERARLTNSRPVDPQANDLFFLGRAYCDKWTADDFSRSITFLRRAIDQDSTFALAWAWLSSCYAGEAMNSGDAEPPVNIPLAKAAALRALELDSTLGLPHVTLGWIRFITDFDFDGPDRDFRQALELSPGSSEIHAWYADYLMWTGRFDEALRERRQAIDLNPLDRTEGMGLGWEYFLARRYDEAIAQLRRTLALEPGYWDARELLSLIYSQQGMHEAAVALCDSAMAEDPHHDPQGDCGYVYGRAGRRQQALDMIRQLTVPSQSRGVDMLGASLAYVGLGDRDHAIEWLRRAAQKRSRYLVLLKLHPSFDPLRSDPRFQSLLRELGIGS
jgi:DNA-binding SARP family transcriptional activator/TolB-like protein